MLEAEISPAGAVSVEGHHVGELQGFRFTADASAAGEDGKAVRAAAQKALASEFETRAERFSACANGDLALANDGTLRWLGQPIGVLAAGEDPLRPRVILLADEQLTGPARDKVAARAERFVAWQVESLLKPLVDLKSAEQLSGIARGIAYRLVENFGLINRRDIADEIKSLDQEGRASLRRLGIRFGAYHIFLPALLKPGPAGLVTLLWALSNDGKDKPGFGDPVNALAAGRTSVVVDPQVDREFYKLAGYRMLGRRAVRVDILERVADLIRPALAWKPGSGPRPDSAYDGSAFLVTPPMMSILGATAADMEEILKALGYRAEPKPQTEVVERLARLDAEAVEAARARAEAQAAAASARAAAAEPVSADAGGVEQATVEGIEAAPTDGDLDLAATAIAPVVAETEAVEAIEAPETPVDEEPAALAAEAVAPVVAETVETGAGDASTADAVAPEADAADATPAEPEAPKVVLLWRPGRSDGGRRHQRPGDRQGQPGGRRDRGRQQGKGGEKPADATPKEPRVLWRADDPQFQRKPRPEGERDNRPRQDGNKRRDERHEGKRRDERGERNERKFDAPRPPREEKPQRIDPDSPFAKLAALRDQLRK